MFSVSCKTLACDRKLASDYPAWETNLVDFRIHYCVEGLARALKAGDAAEEFRRRESNNQPRGKG